MFALHLSFCTTQGPICLKLPTWLTVLNRTWYILKDPWTLVGLKLPKLTESTYSTPSPAQRSSGRVFPLILVGCRFGPKNVKIWSWKVSGPRRRSMRRRKSLLYPKMKQSEDHRWAPQSTPLWRPGSQQPWWKPGVPVIVQEQRSCFSVFFTRIVVLQITAVAREGTGLGTVSCAAWCMKGK